MALGGAMRRGEVTLLFCPKCGAEYREGFTVCADCGVSLVYERPAETHDEVEYVEYEEILRTFNPADVAVIKSILDGAEIPYFFKGENFLLVRPLVEPAALMVSKEQAARARDLLKDLKPRYKGISGGSDL
jgi:hypothetical protein